MYIIKLIREHKEFFYGKRYDFGQPVKTDFLVLFCENIQIMLQK